MEWISVEERLPPENRHVLAWCSWGLPESVDNGAFSKILFFSCGAFETTDDYEVTHWQPLSDPPEEPKPLPAFYAEDFWHLGRCTGQAVYLRGYGRICILTGKEKAKAQAQGLCDRLNHALILDLDKGTTEGQNDTTTTTDIPPTNGGATRSPCCTDGGTCNRSV